MNDQHISFYAVTQSLSSGVGRLHHVVDVGFGERDFDARPSLLGD